MCCYAITVIHRVCFVSLLDFCLFSTNFLYNSSISQPTFRRALYISSVTKEYSCLRRPVRSGKHGSQTWTIRCQMSRCASNNGHLSTELSAVSSAFMVFTKLSQKFFAATGSFRSGPSSNTILLLATDCGTIPHQGHSNYRQTRRS